MARLVRESHRLVLKLTKKEAEQLTVIRDTDQKAYRRERAAALLKVSGGQSPHSVAKEGLLKPRDPDTVYKWVHSFAKEGFSSLTIKPRKKKEFSKTEKKFLHRGITCQTPQDYGGQQSRWTLWQLLQRVPMLRENYTTESGVWHLLRRLRISWKRGRDWQRCPEKAKAYKIRRIRANLGIARRHRDTVAFLTLDEFSFYRHPVVGAAWWPMGREHQPPAVRSCKANTRGRIVGAINAVTGELTYQIASAITVKRFCQFLVTLANKYKDFDKVYVVLDNWPTVHRHPTTLETFKQLGLIALFLPTYSPESNPIEKVWQHLTAEILKLHRDSDHWRRLKQRVGRWLDQFREPNRDILKMTGLLGRVAIRCYPQTTMPTAFF